MKFVTLLICLDGLAFIAYGILCLTSLSLVAELQRYGIANLKNLIGLLEIIGGIGLLVGLRWRPALSLSSAGLALMMLIAFAFRVRYKDTLGASLPSLCLSLLNGYLAVRSFTT